MLRNLISLQIKILNLFCKFNYEIEALGREKQIIQCTAKMKDSISLKKNRGEREQFLAEKIFHSIEFSNSYQNSRGKKP